MTDFSNYLLVASLLSAVAGIIMMTRKPTILHKSLDVSKEDRLWYQFEGSNGKHTVTGNTRINMLRNETCK